MTRVDAARVGAMQADARRPDAFGAGAVRRDGPTPTTWLVRSISGVLLLASIVPSLSFRPPAARHTLPAAAACRLRAWQRVDDFPEPLAQFETVFWEPRDTDSLRQWIRESGQVRGKRVLEIGTGTGLLALCCLRAGAAQVIATDVNPAAIANARLNAEQQRVADRLETRLVPLDDMSAFAVMGPGERFDLIISNPPWEDLSPRRMDDYALFDRGFQLLHSLLDGLADHLRTDGQALLAYGCADAIQELLDHAERRGLAARVLDDRPLRELPQVFLPGMLIQVTPAKMSPAEQDPG